MCAAVCVYYNSTQDTGLQYSMYQSNKLSLKLECLPSTVSEVPALHTSAAFAPHSLKLVKEWGFVLRTASTYACHLRGQNLANAVSELLHPEHGTLYRYISVRKTSADNSSSLGSKLISSNTPTYDFTSENYWGVNLLTYLLTSNDNLTRTTKRENTYQLKLAIHKKGIPNKQQYN